MQLAEVAAKWDALGFKIVPIRLSVNENGKKNLEPFWKWSTDPYPGFDKLIWTRANGFGIVLGPTEKGWLAYVDADLDAPVKEDPFTVLVKAFPDLAGTYVEKTPRGFHFFVYINKPNAAINVDLKDVCGLELHVNGLAIMAPSTYETGAYQVYTDAEIVQNPNFYEQFKAKFGVKPESPAKAKNVRRIKGEIRPCMEAALKQSHIQHLMRLAIAAEYKGAGYDDETIAELFRNQDDFNLEKTLYQVKTADPNKVATCQSIKEWGYCLGAEACSFFGKPEEPTVLGHLNMIENPDYAGKPVLVEAVVSSTSIAYLVPSDVEATFEDKDGYTTRETQEIDERNPVNIKLVGCNEDIKYRRLKRLFGTGKEVNVRENSYRTIYLVRVRPPVFTLEKRGEKIVDDKGFEYKAFDIYVTSDKPLIFQPSSLVQLEGIPIPNPRTQRTTLLAYKVQFPEETCLFDMDKLAVLKAKFQGKTVKERLDWILSNFEAYSQIVKRRNLATAGFLCFYAPTWIKFNHETQKGWANVISCGDTTTAKTETIRKMIQLLKAGMLITAETASTVGLTGTATQIEREGWFVDWGFLVLLDRKLLAVDGAHKLSAANWASLAESERSGVVSIAKAAKSSAYARTRQLKVANAVDREADKYTTKSLASFLYPCQALMSILDKTSIARLDLAVFADQRDVPPEDINKGNSADYDRDIEFLSESLKWCWSDLAELKFTDGAISYLLEQATALYHDFFCEMIPLASIDLKWKLARLSAALAFLTLSTEDFSTVTVTEEHVEMVVAFMRDEYSKASLNTLAQQTKLEVLTVEDVQQMFSRIEVAIKYVVDQEKIKDVLVYIVSRGGATRDELTTKCSLAENKQLRPLAAALKSEGLIKVSRGYYPEPKLINAYKVTGGFAFI